MYGSKKQYMQKMVASTYIKREHIPYTERINKTSILFRTEAYPTILVYTQVYCPIQPYNPIYRPKTTHNRGYTGLTLHIGRSWLYMGDIYISLVNIFFLPIAFGLLRLRLSLHLAEDAILHAQKKLRAKHNIYLQMIFLSQVSEFPYVPVLFSLLAVFATGVIVGAIITHIIHYKQDQLSLKVHIYIK